MKSDYLYPQIANRQSPDDWKQAGSLDIYQRAKTTARDVLQAHYPELITPEQDRWIRDRYRILLDEKLMRQA
jgi:trimethylamine--corrinoid protein Co-methyltransferase